MIKVRVKTLWLGRVGLRSRFVDEAQATKQDIVVLHGQDQMLLAHGDLDSKVVGRSDKPFPDQFTGEEHYLIYYLWKPTAIQRVLL